MRFIAFDWSGLAMHCQDGRGWLIGTFAVGTKVSGIALGLHLFSPILPTSLLHPLDALLLASEMLQFTDLHSGDNTGGNTRSSIGAEMHLQLNRVAGDGCSRSLCLQDSCLHVCIGSQDLVVMLMKPFLGKNNRQAKAVSPPTHRPFVQTDSGHHLGWVSELFWAFLVPPPTFLCLEPMFAPRA